MNQVKHLHELFLTTIQDSAPRVKRHKEILLLFGDRLVFEVPRTAVTGEPCDGLNHETPP